MQSKLGIMLLTAGLVLVTHGLLNLGPPDPLPEFTGGANPMPQTTLVELVLGVVLVFVGAATWWLRRPARTTPARDQDAG